MTQTTELTKELSNPLSTGDNAATELGKSFKNIFVSNLTIKTQNLTSISADYQLKIIKSSFLTRWFWRFKFNKAQKRLAKCEKIFRQGLV
jgi:hypothetical protein